MFKVKEIQPKINLGNIELKFRICLIRKYQIHVRTANPVVSSTNNLNGPVTIEVVNGLVINSFFTNL